MSRSYTHHIRNYSWGCNHLLKLFIIQRRVSAKHKSPEARNEIVSKTKWKDIRALKFYRLIIRAGFMRGTCTAMQIPFYCRRVERPACAPQTQWALSPTPLSYRANRTRRLSPIECMCSASSAGGRIIVKVRHAGTYMDNEIKTSLCFTRF